MFPGWGTSQQHLWGKLGPRGAAGDLVCTPPPRSSPVVVASSPVPVPRSCVPPGSWVLSVVSCPPPLSVPSGLAELTVGEQGVTWCLKCACPGVGARDLDEGHLVSQEGGETEETGCIGGSTGTRRGWGGVGAVDSCGPVRLSWDAGLRASFPQAPSAAGAQQ